MSEFFLSLNWVDILVFFGLLRGAYVGYQSGVLKEIVRMSLYVTTLVMLVMFAETVIDFVRQNTFMSEQFASFLVYVGLALLIYLVLKIATDFLLGLVIGYYPDV